MCWAPLPTASLAAVFLLALPVAAQTLDVQGTVSEAEGPIRLARVLVQAGDAEGDTLGIVFTDADGTFALTVQGTPAEAAPPATEYAVGAAFPNPTTGARVVVPYTTPGDRPEPAEAEVFDLLGRQTTPGATLPVGAYLVRLRFMDGSVSGAQKVTLARRGARVVVQQTTGRLEAPGAARPTPPAARLATSVSATVIYVTVERAGYVTATRTVDASGGATLSVVLDAAPPPTPQITAPGTVQAGTAVTFDGSASTGASGEPLRYTWAFGDDTRGGTARVAHVYTAPGTYTVTLTVQGAFGATASTTAEVEVSSPPAAAGTAPVRVVATGTTGGIVAGATVAVVGGGAMATTDGEGVAVLGAVPTGVPVTLAVSAVGFATQRVALRLPAEAEQEALVEVTLGARQPSQTLRTAERGGTVTGVEGVRVELPVEGLVHADGTPATGAVEVALTPVDISDDDEIGAFPGAFAGVTPDGRADLILSYGVAEYVFEQDGETLDLMPGKTATIEIPIYASEDEAGNDLAPGQTIPLWSLDGATGEWALEGEGTVVASAASPVGLALRAEVTHFSWWNADIAPDPYRPVPECEVSSESGLPTLQLDETCYIEGEIAGPGGPRGQPNTRVGPDNPQGLPLPPEIDVDLRASARGGTLRGSVRVNGPAGRSESVTIILEPVDLSLGGSIAPDTTLSGSIDPVDEVDEYTFPATGGRSVVVSVSRGIGSPLSGTVTVTGPDDETLGAASFGSGVGRIAFLVPETGLYTIRVDGTSSQAGVYDLTLIERSPQQIAIGTERTVTVGEEGALLLYTFEGRAGQPVDLFVGTELSAFGLRAEVAGPDGTQVSSLTVSRNSPSAFTRLPADGTYFAVVDVPRGPNVVTTSLGAVPTIGIGDEVAVTLRSGEERSFLFSAAPGSHVRSDLEAPSQSGGTRIDPLDGATRDFLGFGIQRLGGGTYRLGVGGSSAVRARVAAIAPPVDVTFGDGGRAEIAGDVTGIGEIQLYRIPASGGDGLLATLTEAGASPFAADAEMDLAAVSAGTEYPARSDVVSGPQDEETGFSSTAPAGLLHALGLTLPPADTYVLAVGPGSLERNSTQSVPKTGTFALRLDRAAAASAIEVDDDLADCPSADTRSLYAALRAAPEGGTVTACAGRHESVFEVSTPAANVTLQGTDRNDVVLSPAGGGATVLRSGAPAFALRTLTVEGRSTSQLSAAFVISGVDAVVEDVTFRPADGVPRVGVAIQARGDRVTVQNVRMERAERVLDSRGARDGGRILGSTFVGSAAIVEVSGTGWVIQDNVFEVDAIGAVINAQNTSGIQILDNTFTIATPDVGATLSSPAIRVSTALPAGATAVVRGNVITTNEAGLNLSNGSPNTDASILAEQNRITFTGTRGNEAVSYFGFAGSRLTLQNNVFDGVQSYRALAMRNLNQSGEVRVLNNSLRVAPGSNTQAVYPLLYVQTASGFTGAVPLTFANNVLAGIGPTTGVETPAGVTITSDYNLLYNFATPYVGGTATGANDVIGEDPLFTNGLLEVEPGSPAVDAGASSTEVPGVPAVDYDGTARPQGAAVDIGAHER